MRMLPLLVVLPLCAAPVLAQPAKPSPPGTTATAAVSTPAPAAAPQPAAPRAATRRAVVPHRRGSWEQHFADANTSHDGHLTLEQARNGYVTVARHFKRIDIDHKGYVTTDDIRAWHKAQHEARHRNANRRDPGLQPRPAMHRTMIDRPVVPNGPPPAPPKAVGSQARS